MKTSSKTRMAYLEAARGIASIIVVFHHFLLGFSPSLKASVTEGGLAHTPLYLFVNGTGAVAFFFALSGFVLTLKFYQQFSASDLAAAIVKRLPRLALPTGLSMIIGAAILLYLPDSYVAAARITGSGWLATFAGVGFSQDFVPGFADAARNSLLVFLWPGHSQYNSNLWTMVFEFYGSLLVFGLVAICSLAPLRRQGAVVAIHLLLVLICVVLHKLNFVPFIAGSLIAFFYCKRPALFQLAPSAVGVLILIMLAGYSTDNETALILAAGATMILLLGVPLLERRLGGTVGLYLGQLSFPLYLVHVLVLVSATSAAYTALAGYALPRWSVLMLCLGLTWVISLTAAIPFMLLERVWVPALNRWTRAFLRFVRMPTEIQLPDAK
ncbi:acyltransferase family protein [Rhizobium sp. S152]|uniref:acyltransferase family protein n=1 Tax=Rhizobium sp. S152 TaxID=3055038 RepID=UPI0025A9919A|nr:acyltransferase family protein [Rhizobium sp. S152]MDM9629515.1 acyltransferase family protein [Rhizobium sp. S152]